MSHAVINLNQVLSDLRVSGQLSPQTLQELDIASKTYLKEKYNLDLRPVGEIQLPFIEMGKINTSHLLGVNEIIVFAFYYSRMREMACSIDLGANIGLHSVVMSKLGFEVTAFEPDPVHVESFSRLISLNEAKNISIQAKAVTPYGGEVDFVRVLDNTTSSHVQGSIGKNPYGPTDNLRVGSLSLRDILESTKPTIVKMDVEGLEADLIASLDEIHFRNTEMIIEIGSEESRDKIWDFFQGSCKRAMLFSQLIGWNIASNKEDLPASHKNGSVIISSRTENVWL